MFLHILIRRNTMITYTGKSLFTRFRFNTTWKLEHVSQIHDSDRFSDMGIYVPWSLVLCWMLADSDVTASSVTGVVWLR